MTTEEIIKKLQPYLADRKMYQLARDIKLPYARIWRIATGRVKNARFDDMQVLIAHFKTQKCD